MSTSKKKTSAKAPLKSAAPAPLSAFNIIEKKRDKRELTEAEIRWLIERISTGEVPDYQASAFLMATFLNGMKLTETADLTRTMLESGARYDWSEIPGFLVDKHSTGGVGDKVSIVLAPLAAACGLKVPMMAGRGLAHTGGTIDKLEAIPGFKVSLSRAECVKVLQEVGCFIISQSAEVAPADRKLYALRDVTATVECIPLIVASILSKKLAAGTHGLVMDIKVGSGAFMKTAESARKLAQALIRVAKGLGLTTRVVLTDMSQPLGYAAGNAIEIRECIEVLTSRRSGTLSSQDLREVTLRLCAEMLHLSKKVRSLADGRKLALQKLSDGSAWTAFQAMVVAQGGDLRFVQSVDSLPLAPLKHKVTAKKRGYVSKMDTEALGRIIVDLGGGRHKTSDPIDHGVGLIFCKKLGDKVAPGDPLVTAYARHPKQLEGLTERLEAAIEISKGRQPLPKLVLQSIV